MTKKNDLKRRAENAIRQGSSPIVFTVHAANPSAIHSVIDRLKESGSAKSE